MGIHYDYKSIVAKKQQKEAKKKNGAKTCKKKYEY